ncbi:hypothetical protein BDV96DRAFT_2684 [Lophiotrema nucula]|uniref:Arrestin-like N-terminal domain-containing protein n=1 Tax=Lophiotrema nucula TaxID=690887 RepID=A0A6A5ZU51_9PLEO|nr:hypothetical protein BDV96DRAFT_2684 [Lophiotrema nucula]
MGIFSRSKTPEAPLPHLSLSLTTTEEHIFRPNDTVSGNVELSAPYSLTPQAVEVSLWGLSKVWIRTSSSSSNNSTDYTHYRDDAPLFTVTFNLFPQPYALLPDQVYNFPFNFRVPEGTGFNRTECYKNPQDDPYNVLPHHLPPTFFAGKSDDWPDHAKISYGVTAKLVAPGITVSKEQDPLSCTANINFHPLNPNLEHPELSVIRTPKNFTLQSSSLSGAEPSSLGFRKRMQDRFSSQTPKLDFEIGLEIPDRLNAGQEFPFRTSFTVLNKIGNVARIPSINLKIIEIKLIDFTFFRAPRDWSASNTMSGWQHHNSHRAEAHAGQPTWQHSNYHEKKTILNAIPDQQVIELRDVPTYSEKTKSEKNEKNMGEEAMGQESTGDVWWRARIPGHIPPDFRSFAIARSYRVKLKVGVEIGEKKFVAEVESHVQHLGS